MLIIKHNTGFMEWMNKIPFTSSQAIMRITDANRAGLHWAPPHTTWLGARCWETQCVIDGVSVLRVPANLSDSLQQPSGIKKKKKKKANNNNKKPSAHLFNSSVFCTGDDDQVSNPGAVISKGHAQFNFLFKKELQEVHLGKNEMIKRMIDMVLLDKTKWTTTPEPQGHCWGCLLKRTDHAQAFLALFLGEVTFQKEKLK